MAAAQGIRPGVFAFLMHVYAGDQRARHAFFAELFEQSMQDLQIRGWILDRKSEGGYDRCVEAMCVMAVDEWGKGYYSQQRRSDLMGVSRGTWARKYRDIYNLIIDTPHQWQIDASRTISERLT